MQKTFAQITQQIAAQQVPLRLFMLSPLHIGTGETMSPMDYVVHNDTFYRIEQRELFELVKRTSGGAKAFSTWVADRFAQMRHLTNNKEQTILNNDTNPLTFFREIGQEKTLLDFLRQRGGQPVQFDDDNRARRGTDQRLNDVREAIRSNGRAYLPGTSIKGALRTALLYDYLCRHSSIADMEQWIDRQMNDRRVRKEYFANPLEEAAFFCKQKKAEASPRTGEAQMDLLKYIAVADALPVGQPALEVGKINLYLVEKEVPKDSRQRGGKLVASRQKQSSYAEMIAAGQELSSTLSCDGSTLAYLLQRTTHEGVTVKDTAYYIGFRKKLKNLFDLPDALLNNPDADQLAQAILAHCVRAMTTFAQAQRQRQATWHDDYAAQHDPKRYGDRIAMGYKPVNAHQGNLLHLGYAAGFNATTVLLRFLQDQPHRALYERLMDHFKLGCAPMQKGRYTPNINRFPKSRRMVEGGEQIQPLGWIALLGADDAAPVLSSNTAATGARKGDASAQQSVVTPATAPVVPVFYTGKLDFKRPPELDAVVVKSGNPNRVKVYISEDYSPEMDMQAYRSALDVGTVVRVHVQLNKKLELLGVSYRRMKG